MNFIVYTNPDGRSLTEPMIAEDIGTKKVWETERNEFGNAWSWRVAAEESVYRMGPGLTT